MATNSAGVRGAAKRNAPFQIDMATTTSRPPGEVYKLNHKPLPSGWVVDAAGRA